MAVKAYIGPGPRTRNNGQFNPRQPWGNFGNPLGKLAGNGNNAQPPASRTFTITAGHHQTTIPHPADVIDDWGYSNGEDTNNFPDAGAIGAVSGALAAQVETFLEQLTNITAGPPWSAGSAGLTMFGLLPQNNFTTLTFATDQGNIVLTSAAASWNQGLDGLGRNVTNWTWSITPPVAAPFTLGNPYLVTLS